MGLGTEALPGAAVLCRFAAASQPANLVPYPCTLVRVARVVQLRWLWVQPTVAWAAMSLFPRAAHPPRRLTAVPFVSLVEVLRAERAALYSSLRAKVAPWLGGM